MGKVIQFRSKEELTKEKRENVWHDWLEWEKWELENLNYQEMKNCFKADNFNYPYDKDETTMSTENIEFLAREIRYARKEMIRNNLDKENQTIDLTPEDWE
ncbi:MULTISPECIES: hypothetical protein [Oceanobacillus]|nr:hypothetical protein [Oceanobacillus jeddahense]